MSHKFYKHKLLLDEGFPPRLYFPRLNERFDVKHVKDDFRRIGLPDEEVYSLAMQLKRLIVTYNSKDFRRFAHNSKATGVIGVPALMPYYQIDNKITSLLINSSPNALQGKYTTLSSLSEVA